MLKFSKKNINPNGKPIEKNFEIINRFKKKPIVRVFCFRFFNNNFQIIYPK